MQNPYALDPLYAGQADPATGKLVRAYYFLGTTPRAVLAAAQRARPGRDPRVPTWSAADAAILRGHYGSEWQELLTPKDPPAETSAAKMQQSLMRHNQYFGGGDLDFGSLDALDNIENEPAAETSPATEAKPQTVTNTPGLPLYTDIAVYPEDTIFDLRNKLYLASGIAPYRQHLFYYVNEEGPQTPHRIQVDGVPIAPDWRAPAAHSAAAVVLAGISIDPRLEERRESLRIEALDTFIALSPSPGLKTTRVYFVDLFNVIAPLNASERPNDGLGLALQDRYQFDLLYYGGILRHWPLLSADACRLALSEPARVAENYPALEPDARQLAARYEAERAIADRALSWRPASSKRGRPATAVTAATVRVAPRAARVRVDVRNVFDWVPTGPSIAAARLRCDVDPSLLPETGAPHRGGYLTITATKRHASSFGPRAAPAIGSFARRPLRRETAVLALSRTPAEVGPGRPIEYVYLTVHASGGVEASGEWREDDRVGFDEVIAQTTQAIAPTVKDINALGASVFPVGGELALPGEGSSTTIGMIDVSAFWPHALSSAAFRELKTRFRAFEKAGVVGVRGLQQAGAYAFDFRKGIVSYDPRLAEASLRAREGPTRASAHNQYAWLTDAGAAARWHHVFHGRVVRIYHRVTDLRVEILGAGSLAEFDLIQRYVFSFLDSLLTGPDKIRVGEPVKTTDAESSTASISSKRLRRLQESDPDLFDLKKYDQQATVYSVLCQSGRQPNVFNEDETTAMSKKRRESLVKYWNFTEKKPAFYECPDPKFAHLSFRAGIHPLGYCLPCCKKARAAQGSSAALTNERCLGRREKNDSAEEEDLAKSRHVLAYGKEIAPGRLSELPIQAAEGLFLGAIPPPYGLYLVGVDQSVPAVPAAGFAYSLSYAAGEGDETGDEVLSELAALASSLGETYYAIGGGAGAKFASAAALADAILGAFVRRDDDLSPFGPGGEAADSWRHILEDLARHAYGVEVVTLHLKESGTVHLEASAEAATALLGRSASRIVLIAEGPSGVYPVAALDPRLYLRTSLENRWMVARRSFAETYEKYDESPDEIISDSVFSTVCAVLERGEKPGAALDLGLITRWAAASGGFAAVETLLSNFHNQCYGVLLRTQLGAVYMPVSESPFPISRLPVLYGPRPPGSYPAAALEAAVDNLNRYIKKAGEPYDEVLRTSTIINSSGQAVGFIAKLHFYHDPKDATPASSKSDTLFPYDSQEVDAAIAEAVRSPNRAKKGSQAAEKAKTKNRMYKLFVAEFAAALQGERDKTTRGRLAAAINKTQFAAAKSVAALRRELAEILSGHPDDLHIIREIISRAFISDSADFQGSVLSAIDATGFAFDRKTLKKLRELKSHADIVSALKTIMGNRIITGQTQYSGNVFSSCAEDPQGKSCKEGKLVVDPDRLEDFYSILAADIMNPGKTAVLAAASAGVFDALEFIRRPGEWLEVDMGTS